MISFRDFRLHPEHFFPSSSRIEEKFSRAFREANDWIDSESIDVINVETIGLIDAAFESRSIRIWYRVVGAKLDPIPEL